MINLVPLGYCQLVWNLNALLLLSADLISTAYLLSMSMSLKLLDWVPNGKTLDDKASNSSTFLLVSDIINVINEVTSEPKSLVTIRLLI